MKVLIRVYGCKGWFGPSLSAYTQRHILAWCNPYIVPGEGIFGRQFYYFCTKNIAPDTIHFFQPKCVDFPISRKNMLWVHSNEYPQHTFLCRNKIFTRIPLLSAALLVSLFWFKNSKEYPKLSPYLFGHIQNTNQNEQYYNEASAYMQACHLANIFAFYSTLKLYFTHI